jgi:hypothetical protein
MFVWDFMSAPMASPECLWDENVPDTYHLFTLSVDILFSADHEGWEISIRGCDPCFYLCLSALATVFFLLILRYNLKLLKSNLCFQSDLTCHISGTSTLPLWL